MPGITAIPPPSRLYALSSPLPPTLWEVPFGRSLYNSLWEVLSGRWEVVFYSVRFILLALRLWPWRHSQKNKTSFEDIGILSFAGLAVTGTVVHCLWPTTPTSAYLALPAIQRYISFLIIISLISAYPGYDDHR